jgi:uncharacterized membrane protein YgdD (TMEM256/DUF423 family)
MQKRLILFAGISGAIAVALGAMAAHFLKGQVESGLMTQNDLQAWETGSKYQMYHSIILMGLALLTEKVNSKLLKKSAFCFMAGIVLFSGSLYLLSTAGLLGISNLKWLGPITPIGGIFLITGWLLLALSAVKKEKP